MCVQSQDGVRDRVRYLMCGVPLSARKRRFLALLKYYIDDSGSDHKLDGLFVLYGYLMEEPRWEDFAEKWDAVLRDPEFFPIPYCRMSDAEAREGAFVSMDQPFRYRKVKLLAEVVRNCHPTAVGCKMAWRDYNEIVKGKVDSRLDSPYAVLFFQVMRSITDLQVQMTEGIAEEVKRQVLKDQGVEIGIKPVDFIFDKQGAVTEEQCLRWWGQLKLRVPQPDLTVIGNTPQFKDDRELNPLQAADMLAWHIRRDFDYPGEDRRQIFELLTPAGVWERNVSRESLEQVVKVFNSGKIDPASV
jgi:hypothetical protein